MAFRCEYCGDMVWVTDDVAIEILNGVRKCKCAKCSTSRMYYSNER